MARSKRRGREGETNYWIGYTDLLSNSLLVLLLTIAVAALARANNEKPPFLPLTEKESFRFGTGSYRLTPQFKAALNSKLPWIREQIKKYRIDIVEVVGHTDGQRSPGSSNLDLLLRETTYNFTVYCKAGNHSRITPKVRASTELGNSLELALYVSMMKRYQGNPRVKFHIEPSYYSIVNILGTRVRFHHGHAVAYGGGVGGLHIPLRKAIKSWNETARADLDIMGHYHSFLEHTTAKYMVNGSLIGYSAYAERVKAVIEPPLQGYCLIHKKYGVTRPTPIFAE